MSAKIIQFHAYDPLRLRTEHKTAAALTSATRRLGGVILAEHIHFTMSKDGRWFDFINKRCATIAKKALEFSSSSQN